MKFILICATGRSGSTTLQRIINTIDDSNITGEKWGAISNLLECYSNIKITNHYSPKMQNSTKFMTIDRLDEFKMKPAWYNSYDFVNVKDLIKKTIINILSENSDNFRVLGYKEIRWMDRTHLIKEFVELFPDTKIICHIDDNINRQSTSAWYKKNESSKKQIEEHNRQLIEFSNNNDYCYLSYMKNLFIVDEMKKMFNFLDETFDQQKYTYIINNKFE